MSLEANWNTGGSRQISGQGSRKALRDILHALTGISAAQLTALRPNQRFAGMPASIADGRRYVWDATSVLAASAPLILAADDAPSAGRWLLEPGQEVQLTLAVDESTADAAVLYTVPVGAALLPLHAWWAVTTSFTGGSSSTIGASSDATGLSTKGDLIGGAAGSLAAALTAGSYRGDKGVAIGNPDAVIAAGEVIRHDLITSDFTAGAGSLQVMARLLLNAGV